MTFAEKYGPWALVAGASDGVGAAFAKGLTLKMGQTHVHRYLRLLMEQVRTGRVDPSQVISHRLTLGDGPAAYETFKHKEDACIKVVMRPHAAH